MKEALRNVAATVALAVAALAAETAAEDGRWSVEQQAVIDTVSEGPVGIESDFDGWAEGYANAWTYWRIGDPGIRPRDEHMALVREFIDAGNRPTDFELEPVDVIVRGDVALLRLVATEKLASAGGDERVVRYATATMLVLEDGKWKNFATNIVYLDNE